MAKIILIGFLIGLFVVIGAVFLGWKIVLIAALFSILVAPFATSGKGDRNYNNQ